MDHHVAATLERVEQFMADKDDALALPRVSGELCRSLVLARQAKRCVEIGTSYGYSGLWLASAAAENGGVLITIDQAPHKTARARAFVRDAGLEERVEFLTGAAADLLPRLDGPIDFVLNDADKENCRRYVELLIPKLADRAVVLTDNTTSHASELAGFVAWIRGHEAFWSSGLVLGSGMEMSVYLGGA